MVTIRSSLLRRLVRQEFGGWLAEDAARICTTREFWQIRRQNKFVFTRQARPSLYLFPISQVLHLSQTAMCTARIHSGKCQSSPNRSAQCSLELKAAAVGTWLRRSGVDQLRE